MPIRPNPVSRSAAGLRALLGLPPGEPFVITGVTLDSRRVRQGDLYAALPGFTTHGARFAPMAVAAGAAAILTDPTGAGLLAGRELWGVPVLVVPDPRGVLGEVSAWIYGRPAAGLRTTGITGTNGKTTTSYLLDAALRAGGFVTGIVGTVATQIGDEVLPATRTTPEAPDLHALLAVMVQRGADAVTMEVSSHALSLGRIDGVVLDLAVFTNLSRDHLDFHGDMAQYFSAKADLFTPRRARAGIVCVDDAWGQRLADAATIPTTTYAVDGPADWTVAEVLPADHGAATFAALGPGGVSVRGGVGLPGRFNIANALAALAAAVHHGVDPQVAAGGIRACLGVPGRMERVAAGQPFLAFVDYAHTPDAVARAIAAAREVTTGRIIVVMGCGGDRDRDKRPLMGEVAATGADIVVITDDNPRSESPPAIRAAIMEGVRRVADGQRAEVAEEGDRRAAIGLAVGRAQPGDAVLVLGKGHEQGQEAGGVITPFDDRVELRAAVEAMA
ncbi:MAG: UDP-N-acetylmuramoyl-L-alanyl-D-glutamate--2,6-diaminopimelate ligase [Candidatus Nanopelagicales bacterium]